MRKPLTEQQVSEVLARASFGRIGLSLKDRPYVLPLCFALRGNALYFHGPPEGRKMDYLRGNPRACFQVDEGVELLKSPDPCLFNVRFRSVLLEGPVAIVEDKAEKLAALKLLAEKYGGTSVAERLPAGAAAGRVTVCKITVETAAGRENGG